MGFVPLTGIADYGVMQETPAHKLPPEAWTRALNVRFVDKRAQKMGGHGQVMGTPSVPPGFVMMVDNDGDVFWIYAQAGGSGSKVYVYNSGTHNDISKVGGYDISLYRNWNGDVFNGIPVLNYGAGAPQFWPTPVVSDLLEDIPAWPANTTCKILKAFGNYLVALNVTDLSGAHPNMVKWSDGAGVGELPQSWDPTNPAFDADEVELGDINSGAIQEGLALRDFFCIFKDESTWIMRYIGGQRIHSIKPQMKSSGILAARCAQAISIGKSKLETAFIMTGEDLGTFDGQDFLSVVEDRDRKFLVGDIDPRNYKNSFVLDNRAQDEAWFCYPENGETDPTMACVWNYKENTITFREFEGTSAANGSVEGATLETWATVTGTWATVSGAWQEATRKKVIVSQPFTTKLLQLELGDTFDGVSFNCVLERVGLAVTGVDRQGNPTVNYNSRKIISRVWPQLRGGSLLVQLGGADTPNPEDVTWQDGVVYDPTAGVRFCDPAGDDDPANWVYNAIRFSSTADEPWFLDGYGIDVEELSEL